MSVEVQEQMSVEVQEYMKTRAHECKEQAWRSVVVLALIRANSPAAL